MNWYDFKYFTYRCLANTPSKILKEIGSVDIKKAQELLDSVEEKKIKKIEKRQKGIDKKE